MSRVYKHYWSVFRGGKLGREADICHYRYSYRLGVTWQQGVLGGRSRTTAGGGSSLAVGRGINWQNNQTGEKKSKKPMS